MPLLTNSSKAAPIAGVIDAMPAGSDEEREARVRRALWLFGLLPEFNVIY